jgi:hypothetical protein
MSFGFTDEKTKTAAKESYTKTAEQQAMEELQQSGSTTGTTATNSLSTGSTTNTGTSSTLGTSAQQTAQQQQAEVNPWAATEPYLQQYLSQLGQIMPQAGQMTSGQQAATDTLRQGMATGPTNPYGAQVDQLTQSLFGSQSYAPDLQRAYQEYSGRLASTADGRNLDMGNNPQLQAMLDQVASQARTSANETFAGAGRSFSGAHAQALADGVSRAQLPMLFNQYNLEQGRTDQAARDLFAGAGSTATGSAGLDQQAAMLRAMGIDTAAGGFGLANQAYDQKLRAGQDQMTLETMLRDMGINDMSQIGSLLYGAAGLGQSSTGNLTGTQTGQTGQTTNMASQTLTQEQQQVLQQQQIEEIISKLLTSSQSGTESGTGTSSGTANKSGFNLSGSLFG